MIVKIEGIKTLKKDIQSVWVCSQNFLLYCEKNLDRILTREGTWSQIIQIVLNGFLETRSQMNLCHSNLFQEKNNFSSKLWNLKFFFRCNLFLFSVNTYVRFLNNEISNERIPYSLSIFVAELRKKVKKKSDHEIEAIRWI